MHIALGASTNQTQGSEAVPLDGSPPPQVQPTSGSAESGLPVLSEDPTLDVAPVQNGLLPWADQDLTLLGHRMDSYLGFPNLSPASSET